MSILNWNGFKSSAETRKQVRYRFTIMGIHYINSKMVMVFIKHQ